MNKKEQGFVPIILIVGAVVILVFLGLLAFLFFGGLNSSDRTTEESSQNQTSRLSPEAQRVLDEGVDYRTLECTDTDLTGCDDKNEGDNPTFID